MYYCDCIDIAIDESYYSYLLQGSPWLLSSILNLVATGCHVTSIESKV